MDITITRLDPIEYEVLDCASPDGFGYYPRGPQADRARLLMKEGIIEDSPHSEWNNSGWKLTPVGLEYHKEFLRRVRERHGHVWLTIRETDEYGKYKEGIPDDYGDRIDDFALSSGYHNGPKCKVCGYEFCRHCTSETDVPVCTGKAGEYR